MKLNKIAVLGAGSWGTALAVLLAENGHAVSLWGHDKARMQRIQETQCNEKYFPALILPQNLQIELNIEACVANADEVLIVVPSAIFSLTLMQIKASIPKTAGVFWGSKGLDPSGVWLHEKVIEVLGADRNRAVLSGPSFAKEVIDQKPTAVTIAANTPEYAAKLCTLVSNHYFRAYQSSDLIGVQLGGALKNSLAIAAGLVDGLALGANARAALITRGLAEMMRLGQAVGALPSTLMGLSGVGDLILTCTDNQSRNHRFGSLLGQGLTVDEALTSVQQIVEGIKSTHSMLRLAQKLGVEMPITACIAAVLNNQLSVDEALRSLFARPLKAE